MFRLIPPTLYIRAQVGQLVTTKLTEALRIILGVRWFPEIANYSITNWRTVAVYIMEQYLQIR